VVYWGSLAGHGSFYFAVDFTRWMLSLLVKIRRVVDETMAISRKDSEQWKNLST
jgi:hypothetical protein